MLCVSRRSLQPARAGVMTGMLVLNVAAASAVAQPLAPPVAPRPPAGAQSPGNRAPQPPVIGAQVGSADPGLAAAGATPSDYQVGPGDLLTIGVSGTDQLSVSTRISNSGKIRVPRLGVIKAADLTIAQLEAEIARQLREKDLVKQPWVSVRIDQYRAQPVYILGEVMMPGQFVIKKDMYLVDLLTLAGGLNEVATPVGYLYRRQRTGQPAGSSAPAEEEAIPIDFRALSEGTKPELNVKMQGGDVLYVPERRKSFYFVVGDVNRPGFFELAPDDGTMRVSQAVAKAGGPMRTAKMSAGTLVRFTPDGAREEFKVDFKAILTGKQPDMFVKSSDIIFIPGSATKTVSYGLLGVLPTVATQRSANVAKGALP